MLEISAIQIISVIFLQMIFCDRGGFVFVFSNIYWVSSENLNKFPFMHYDRTVLQGFHTRCPKS